MHSKSPKMSEEQVSCFTRCQGPRNAQLGNQNVYANNEIAGPGQEGVAALWLADGYGRSEPSS